jgi:hypothetical protein
VCSSRKSPVVHCSAAILQWWAENHDFDWEHGGFAGHASLIWTSVVLLKLMPCDLMKLKFTNLSAMLPDSLSAIDIVVYQCFIWFFCAYTILHGMSCDKSYITYLSVHWTVCSAPWHRCPAC